MGVCGDRQDKVTIFSLAWGRCRRASVRDPWAVRGRCFCSRVGVSSGVVPGDV